MAYTNRISVVGDPFDKKTWHGPHVSKIQYEKVLSYIQSAEDKGATTVAGGQLDGNRANGKGYYILPTIIGDVKPSMRCTEKGFLGPCVVSSKSSDEADVICSAIIAPIIASKSSVYKHWE